MASSPRQTREYRDLNHLTIEHAHVYIPYRQHHTPQRLLRWLLADHAPASAI